MRWRRTTRAQADETGGPDGGRVLVPDWARVADGRPWRLRRGVDFEGDVDEFILEARRAADLMGRAALTMPDRRRPDRFVWTQFIDGDIEVGAPCRCGSLQLARLTSSLLRCEQCAAVLIQRQRRQARKAAADQDTGAEPDDAAPRVDAFSDVRLTRFERLPNRHQYVGFGRDADGRKVVLIVTVPVAHGAPVPDEASSMGVVHSVTFVLADAGDAEEQFDELWDIAFD